MFILSLTSSNNGYTIILTTREIDSTLLMEHIIHIKYMSVFIIYHYYKYLINT